MKLFLKSALTISAVLICCAILSCSDDHGITVTQNERFYEPGEALSAIPMNEAQTISLFLWKETGQGDGTGAFIPLSNGDYVKPGPHTLGIKTTRRMMDGAEMDQRVFLSDGGWETQFEASFDEASGLYVCQEFKFLDSTTYLTHPLLVQVIYPDALSAKEKFVVITDDNLRPDSGVLVERGLTITLSDDILDSLKEAMAPLISDQLGEEADIEITKLGPAHDNESGHGIFSMELGMGLVSISLDLALKDTYLNESDDEIRALTLGIENLAGGSSSEGLLGNMINFFVGLFLGPLGLGDKIIETMALDEIAVTPIAFPLRDMISGFGGSADSGDGDLLSDMLKHLELDSILFLNVSGLPEKTDENFAAIAVGLYATNENLVETDSEGTLLWPEVNKDNTQFHTTLERIKTSETDVGIAISQYNLNQLFYEMMHGFKIRMKGMQDVMPFGPEDPDNTLDLIMTINQGGMAIDFKTETEEGLPGARLVINDVRIQLIEVSSTSEEPKAEISMDLTMDLKISVRKENGKSLLVLAVEPDPELSHLHVMKDNMDLVMFDHSKFISLIFSGLAGTDGGDAMEIPLPLSDMGLNARAGTVELDGSGNCFMSLAVESLDTGALPIGGGCFIMDAQI